MLFTSLWNLDLTTKSSMSIVSNCSSLLGSLTFSKTSLGLRFIADGSCLSNRLGKPFGTSEYGRRKRQASRASKSQVFRRRVTSAIESAACLDASVAKRFVSIDRIHPGKEMLGRIVAMLTRLVDRFDIDEARALALDRPPS
jgi:hypothetical protein